MLDEVPLGQKPAREGQSQATRTALETEARQPTDGLCDTSAGPLSIAKAYAP